MRTIPVLALALLLPACGDAATATTETGQAPGASESTGTADSTGTGANPTTGLDSSTAPLTTDDPATGTGEPTTGGLVDSSTGEPTTSTTTPPDDTTGEPPPPPPPDPCADVEPVCPGAPPKSAGGGLVEIDRCAFPLHDQDTWAAQAARVDALAEVLPRISLASLPAAEFNRSAVSIAAVPGGVKNVVQAFRWDDEDNDKDTWIPQGISGTADATVEGTVDGRELIVVTWYHDTKGARISVVDIADPAKPRYRHILLVEPIAGDPVNFKPIPIHAGGTAWVGDYLYVVDTGKGFRVFDTTALLRVATEVDSIGYDAGANKYYGGLYKYVLPQVGAYVDESPCKPLFSSVALDRSSDPPSLISSEYCSGSNSCDTALNGRLYRWPLDPVSSRLAAPVVWPQNAYYMGQSHVQGAMAHEGDYWLSSSAPGGADGALYVLPGGGKSTTYGWVDSPEDLMRDGDRMWSLSEGAGARTVFAVPMAKFPG